MNTESNHVVKGRASTAQRRCTAHGVVKDANTELAPQRLDAKPAAPLASAVPLPAAAPLFGAALLARGVAGYGLKRKADAAEAAGDAFVTALSAFP